MKSKHPYPIIALLVFLPALVVAEAADERTDWAGFFEKANARGTIVISDERPGRNRTMAFNGNRAEQRFPPASTFKIPHALFALDAGVVQDEFQTIPWDGVQRSYPEWNRDQNLRSSMRHSVVWVYEGFAREIGPEKMRGYLEKIHYGNKDSSGRQPFWIEGNLRISAREQVEFLKNFHRNRLPFAPANQRLVKDVLIVEAGREWILRAKSGWSGSIGWWVGWVDLPEGPVFFALNIDTPNQAADLPKREGITRGILQSMGALP